MLLAWLFGRPAPSTPADDPLVAVLRELAAAKDQEIAYLRVLLAKEQERSERVREECLIIAARQAAQDVQFYRTAREAPPLKVADTIPPYRDGVPPYLANQAHGQIDEDDLQDAVPENAGLTEDELADQTIEDEAKRRESERLMARGA